MSLSLALNTAKSSMASVSAQISTSAKNISGATDATYSRKIAATTTTADGSVRYTTVRRAQDTALYNKMLGATSSAAEKDALLNGLDRLADTVGDTENEGSPASKIQALANTLTQYANLPSDQDRAASAVTAAKDLAATLNDATSTVTSVRQQADADMASSVENINDLLGQFQDLNNAVIRGTVAGADISTQLDQRDAVLAKISEELGVTTVTRGNNDMAIYTDSGVTLFETTARKVEFNQTTAYSPATVGNAVYIDGVQVTGAGASMPLQSGKLVGLATLRDEVAPTYQAQLDEVARGLIDTFQDGGADGLFTKTGSVTGVGLAGAIVVNAAVDPDQGGNPVLLRDGINTDYNPDDAASFSDRLFALTGALSATRTDYSAAAGIGTTGTLAGFASSSVGWLQNLRSDTTSSSQYQNTLLSNASEALSNVTGVNLDDEYALQLSLEQSYTASAKLMSVVQKMFDDLLSTV
ncbi:flagellar hook-associated protein 1 FlgK [Pseudoxanthobacter soli DSM 19599]|uniref:Flagellar hook-associated protein 1 n=1 Tax=Pseudoxanthobacter soli DSM 19599 TaxID=1123029 RepID=A0A1M7ZEC7_9HYPH|nr:flagellar hook-associated protein FlgK [Pseudoxanthobacter soli]SHO63224.1 flagellar hook-associated protein 1 FlgK [Pseudoxanthobacter soli DSM 19599]